jgi:hypothetical protein
MGEYWSRVEGRLKFVEGGATVFSKIPLLAFAGESGKGKGNVCIGVDESPIEIAET